MKDASQEREKGFGVKRSLPLWIVAIVPAALAGHGLAYALIGRNAHDGVHFWVAPALQCSLALLLGLSLVLVAGNLFKIRLADFSAAERSVPKLWLRLTVAQVALFSLMECAEGSHPGLLGWAVQAAVALFAAYLLSLFSQLLVCCSAGAREASQYLARLWSAPRALRFTLQPHCVEQTLAVRAGNARLKRPPPIR